MNMACSIGMLVWKPLQRVDTGVPRGWERHTSLQRELHPDKKVQIPWAAYRNLVETQVPIHAVTGLVRHPGNVYLKKRQVPTMYDTDGVGVTLTFAHRKLSKP